MGLFGAAAFGLVIGWLTRLVRPADAVFAFTWRFAGFAIVAWASSVLIAWFHTGEQGAWLTALGLVAGLALVAMLRQRGRVAGSRGH
jgi:hypothetical protein